MIDQYKFGERLKWIIKYIFGISQAEFARMININNRSQVNQYIKSGIRPKEDILSRIENVGINIKYLDYGGDNLFANNEAGDLLREQYEKTHNIYKVEEKPITVNESSEEYSNGFSYEKKEIGKRLKQFITDNYKDISAYGQQLGIPRPRLTGIFGGFQELSAEELTKIKDSGCSIDWLIDGEGNMYASNDAGEYLADQSGQPKPETIQEQTYKLLSQMNELLKNQVVAAANSKLGDKDYVEE